MSDVPRRSVLEASLFSALAASGAKGGTATPMLRATRDVRVVATLGELTAEEKAAPTGLFFVEERGREGWFVCELVDALMPADPLHGLSCPSSVSGLHYRRVWDGVHGRPEWFGARVDAPTFDCAPAIEACYALCQVTQFAAADYYIQQTLRFDRSGRSVSGVGRYGTVRGQATRIILAQDAPDAHSDDMLVVGATSGPKGGGGIGEGEHFVAENHIKQLDAAP